MQPEPTYAMRVFLRALQVCGRLVGGWAAFACMPVSWAAATRAADTRIRFDLPADSAVSAIRRFSEQTGLEVIYASHLARDIRTQRVSGLMTPREALDAMLRGTGLVALQQEQTGAFTLRRQSSKGTADRTPTGATNDSVKKNEPREPMNNNRLLARVGRALAVVVAASGADAAAQASNNVSEKSDESGAPVQLSPFEVRADNTGYHSSSVMSGTRLNSKIEDLASSISVVTKQQMLDFAMLDINDLFNYEASTEGTGNYTAISFDSSGQVTDEVQDDPHGSNRIRGMGRANIAMNNFATSGRVPIDPINIEAVEISRGPNSNIFGLGGGAGTVNLVAASANLARRSATAVVRFDDVGGWRRSLDLNYPLIRNKLAARGSAVFQRDGSSQKPAAFNTERYNVMLRAQPFSRTTIRGSYQRYNGLGNRPNAATLRDGVTYWQSLGGPTWDPVERTMTVNGVTTFYGATNPPLLAAPNGGDRGGAVYVEPDQGIVLWTIKRTPAPNNANGPLNNGGQVRLLNSPIEDVRVGRPLFATYRTFADKSLYDYNKINLAAPNRLKDSSEIASVSADQIAVDGERHKLAFQYAWQREDSDRRNRNIIGKTLQAGSTNFIFVDVNSRLLDGRPNPFFLRPYIETAEPNTNHTTFRRDTHRLQGVYTLNLARQNSWLRWVGRHQLLGYYERRKTATNTFRFGDSMISDHPLYARPGTPRQGAGTPIATRANYRFYIGDAQGQNVEYAPGSIVHGDYTFRWFDAVTNQWIDDPATLGDALRTPLSGARNGALVKIETKGAVLQSALLQDRLIFTGGVRTDENKNKYARPGATDPVNLWQVDYAAMDGYEGNWDVRTGDTTTYGVVARPFRNWGPFKPGERSALPDWAAGIISGLQLHCNRSESFAPEEKAINILLEDLGNPTSQQTEYGFSIHLSDKLSFRVNRYKMEEKNSRRGGGAAELGTRMRRIDFEQATPTSAGNDHNLQEQASAWVTEQNPTWTAQQVAARVSQIMQLEPAVLDVLNSTAVDETMDLEGKGEEYELSFNPTRYWTLRLNAARQESTERSVARGVARWIDIRLPVWRSIIDPRTNTPWFTTRYGPGNETAESYFNANVLRQLELQRATEGLARPQIREWRANLVTNYQLAGIAQNKHLKRMNVGGAVRWEDKGAIGYYGIPVNGDLAAAMRYDPGRPVYDKAHTYVDAFVGYGVRFFGDKVRARFQVNGRNLQESGRLQPVGAYPTGEPHTFRIINPRTFIFTATFDL